MLREALSHFFERREFLRNSAILVGGTAISQVILLASTPILTRLYTPAEYGLFSIFTSVASIFIPLISLKYDIAIVLPESEEEASALLSLSLFLSLTLSILVGFLLLIFSIYAPNTLSADNPFWLVFLISAFILGNGVMNALGSWLTRMKEFKASSKSSIYNSGVGSLSKLLLGVLHFLNFGLIIGQIAGQVTTTLYLLRVYLVKRQIRLTGGWRKISSAMRKYKDFPLYSTSSEVLFVLSHHLPVVLFAYLYSKDMAGLYGLAVRLLLLPSALIGQSVRQVFYQKATELHNSRRNFYDFYKKVTRTLVQISCVPMLIVVVAGGPLFSLFFGENWREAGVYAQILSPWILTGFVSSPAIVSYPILGLQQQRMVIDVAGLVMRFAAIGFGYYFLSVKSALFLFSAAGAVYYLLTILYISPRIKTFRPAGALIVR